jgi:catechol 2,3-dioxygenase-like lactoylglutathione lyase family enzyme
MDWKLELVVVPVSDVDRAKAFYTEYTERWASTPITTTW